jgi:hypothetical protein
MLVDTPPSCLRNVVALFHVIDKEREWRKARGQLEGFEAMLSSKPIVAVGADHPLEDEILMADYFRKPSSVGNSYVEKLTILLRWHRWFGGRSHIGL